MAKQFSMTAVNQIGVFDVLRVLYQTRDKLADAIEALPDSQAKLDLMRWFEQTDQTPEIVCAYAVKEDDNKPAKAV